jgi:hypothetical protein
MRFPGESAVAGAGATLKSRFGDEEKEFKTHTAGPWRWLTLGRFQVKEFEPRPLTISCADTPYDVDKLVLWSETGFRDEEWYREGVSPLWAKGSPALPVFDKADGQYFVEAESAPVLQGEKRTHEGATVAVLMSEESSELGFLLDVSKGAAFQVLLKARSEERPDSPAEGPVFVFLDGELLGRVGPELGERWQWHRAGASQLAPGIHLLSIVSGRTSVQIDKFVLYGGDPRKMAMEDWYRATLSPLYQQEAKPGRVWAQGQKEMAIEAEGMDQTNASVMRDAASAGRAIVFDRYGQWAEALISVQETTRVRAFARVYFDLENQIAGDANSVFLGFDAEGLSMLADEVYNQYHWLATPPTELLAGKHLISFRPRELPVRIDKIVLTTAEDVSKEPWYAETFPEPMPMDLPNDLRREEARQAQNWLVFGELARTADVKLTHAVTKNHYYSVEVNLPAGENGKSLVLRRRGHAVLRTLPALVSRNRPQQVDMWVFGDGSACGIYGVLADAEGKEFVAPFADSVSRRDWRLATMDLATLAPDNERLLTPQFPVTFKHLVVRKKSDQPATLRFEEPEFVRHLDARAACEGGEIVFDIENRSPEARSAFPLACVMRFSDWQSGKSPPDYGSRGQADVPANGTAQHRLRLRFPPVPGGPATEQGPPAGLWTVLSQLAPGVPSPRFLAVGEKAAKELSAWLAETEPRRGCFRLAKPLTADSGEPISPDKVPELYSKTGGFRVLVDGLDACSREYAAKAGHERLKPTGWDLSDSNGWPFIHVPPGVLAIDPTNGRIKFAEGDADPPQMAGRLNTGFGVPGSGRIAVKGDFAFVPAGEGDMTVVNCSDKRNPKVAAVLPSYHFTHSVVLFGDVAYMDSRSNGVCLIDDLSDPEHPGPIRQIPWLWGRGIPAIHPEAKLVYVFGDGKVKLIDISVPDRPREVGEVPLERKMGRFLMTPDRQFAYGLADGGGSIGVVSLQDPRQPKVIGAVPNVKASDLSPRKVKTEDDVMAEPEDGAAEEPKTDTVGIAMADKEKELEKTYESDPAAQIVAVGDRNFVLRLKETFIVYDISEPAKPRRCGQFTFQEQRMVIRDAELKGDYLLVADGREGPGQHELGLGSPHSRLFVVDFTDRMNPKLAAQYEDPDITEYSNLTICGDYAYVNDYDFGLWIFDVSDPRKPQKLGGTPTAGEGHWGLAHGDFAFLGQTFGGSVIVIDVSDPAKPKRCGTYWDGVWLNYNARMAACGTSLYLPRPSDLAIIDFSDPYRPRKVGQFTDEKGRPLIGAKILVEDGLACIACQRDGKAFLHVYDLSDPSQPKLLSIAVLEEKAVPFRIAKDGHRLFAAGDFGTYLHAIDVSEPASPKVISRFSAPQVQYGEKSYAFAKEGGWNGGVSACRGYVYVTTGGNPPGEPVVHIFDARNPEKLVPVTPILVPRGGWQFFYVDVLALGNYLYGGDYGVIDVFDVSDPASPKPVGASGRDYQWTLGNVQGDYLGVGKLPALELVDVPRSPQVPRGKVTVERIS